jgi:hypothetical protein
MDDKLTRELLDEVIPYLEKIEAQSAAVLELLKEKGLATNEQLTAYLEQASNASNVRWRAARLRIERILEASNKNAEPAKSETKPKEGAKEKNAGRQAPKSSETQVRETESETGEQPAIAPKATDSREPDTSDKAGDKESNKSHREPAKDVA